MPAQPHPGGARDRDVLLERISGALIALRHMLGAFDEATGRFTSGPDGAAGVEATARVIILLSELTELAETLRQDGSLEALTMAEAVDLALLATSEATAALATRAGGPAA